MVKWRYIPTEILQFLSPLSSDFHGFCYNPCGTQPIIPKTIQPSNTDTADQWLFTYLTHCLSAASAVCYQLSVKLCISTPAFDVRSSGLSVAGLAGWLQLVTRLPVRSVTFIWQLSLGAENFSLLVLLAHTAHWRLSDHALYKSTFDTDTGDIHEQST